MKNDNADDNLEEIENLNSIYSNEDIYEEEFDDQGNDKFDSNLDTEYIVNNNFNRIINKKNYFHQNSKLNQKGQNDVSRNHRRLNRLSQRNNPSKDFADNSSSKTLTKKINDSDKSLKSSIKNMASNTKNKFLKKKEVKADIEKAKKTVMILKSPVFWTAIGVLVCTIAIIFFIAVIAGAIDSGSADSENNIASDSCTYSLAGVNVEDLQVELINCDGTESDYDVIQTVPFEKYVLGVALAEIGESAPDEALKAQIIMARNFALSRNKSMCPSNSSNCFYGLQSDDKTIRLRMCENDQVYWDYTKDIYTLNRGGINKYSPEISESSSGASLWKSALSSEKQIVVETIAKDVLGKLAVDSTGNLSSLGYTNVQSTQATDLANEGYDYVQILKKVYTNVDRVSTSTCKVKPTIAVGDYSTWKQDDPQWGNNYIGTKTIGRVGCAATSLAIILARSGVENTIANLNPGTFVEAYKKVGGFDNNIIMWNKIPDVTINNDLAFSYEVRGTFTDQQKKDKVKELINDNCLLIMQVKSGEGDDEHYVAIDDITTSASNFSSIYMWDPASSSTDVFEKYSRTRIWGNRFLCYKVTS